MQDVSERIILDVYKSDSTNCCKMNLSDSIGFIAFFRAYLCKAERLKPITPLARLPMDESLQSRAANADDLADSFYGGEWGWRSVGTRV